MYRQLLKPILFSLDPEKAHHTTFAALKTASVIPGARQVLQASYSFGHPQLEREVLGLNFKNPVGLAAGLDKNAQYVDELALLGFGFVEIGTITPKPQPGNPKPRLFRLPQHKALINRMGFNNEGAAAAAKKLSKRKSNIIIGGNIGKNKTTPNEAAVKDYSICFNTLYDVVDYFVVNVSSPNTPGLRDLQEKEPLTKLLLHLQNLNEKKGRKPLLLKIAPDLTEPQLDEIIKVAGVAKLSGLIATNTTINRENISGQHANETGGLSGKPVKKISTHALQYLHRQNPNLPLIGVGGIMNGEGAVEKIAAGASLVQVYTGLIYRGPGLVKDINKRLLKSQ